MILLCFAKNIISLLYKSFLKLFLLRDVEIYTILKSVPLSLLNNVKRLYQIDEIL